MGIYINPGNAGFKKIANDPLYVDKTMLLSFINTVVNTDKNCVALSHARRFGKSQAARMLEAYYSRGCDSRALFERWGIAKTENWDLYLNKFNVIHLDMSTFAGNHKENLVEYVIGEICEELEEEYPSVDYTKDIAKILSSVCKLSDTQFVIIIDEWDCVIRNQSDRPDLGHKYMQFLHDIFKSNEASNFLALGYVTGILPIKKIKDESALNNFMEFTMLSSYPISEYYGFTEDEVKWLCHKHELDFESIRQWYNGYLLDDSHMYNPNSVYSAIVRKKIDSYWKNTSSYDAINTYITINADGLKDDVLSMLSGGRASVNVKTFQNDLSVIRNKNEALTALIHLGYLAYDAEMEEAFIPNYEVATAYEAALEESGWTEVAKSIENASRALKAIIRGSAEELANYIDCAHEAYTSIKNYNNENSLYSVLYMALFTARAFYNVERELPAGKGFADMTLIPRKNVGNKPAIIIELKYDKDADTAIRQIKEKRYAGKLAGYADKIMLVGINYDKDTKAHTCIIESTVYL